MAGNTLLERWANDSVFVGFSRPKAARDPMAWAALVPTNLNGEAPEDVCKAERVAVIEWIESKLSPTSKATLYIRAYFNYIGQGNPPKADFVPDIDLAEFLPMKKGVG